MWLWVKPVARKKLAVAPLITDMPTEIILMIASHLCPCSRTCLGLVCKRFYDEWKFTVLSDKSKSRKIRNEINLPREIPSYFRSKWMSEPWTFHPERWELFWLLQRDISDKWLLCHDCFILHPISAFDLPKRTFWRCLLAKIREFFMYEALRSCQKLRPPTPDCNLSSYSPTGYVDLCPCIRLTPARKARVCVPIPSTWAGPDPVMLQNRHSCDHWYGSDRLLIFLYPFVLQDADIENGNRNLHYRIRYHYIRSNEVRTRCPRLTCPHIRLGDMVDVMERCFTLHGQDVSCGLCQKVRCCPECKTRVLSFETRQLQGNRTTCVIELERRLDDENWSKQVVFPYARQRSYDVALAVKNRKALRSRRVDPLDNLDPDFF